jgi:hypothetical protein
MYAIHRPLARGRIGAETESPSAQQQKENGWCCSRRQFKSPNAYRNLNEYPEMPWRCPRLGRVLLSIGAREMDI